MATGCYKNWAASGHVEVNKTVSRHATTTFDEAIVLIGRVVQIPASHVSLCLLQTKINARVCVNGNVFLEI